MRVRDHPPAVFEFIRLMAPVITLTRSATNLPPDLSKSVTRSHRDDAAASLHRKTYYRNALERTECYSAFQTRPTIRPEQSCL